MTNYYNEYVLLKAQNEEIDKQLKEQYATHKSKTIYTSQKIVELRNFNFILFILYYISVFILILYFFLLNRTNFSFIIKIIIIILFIVYPFLIQWIELFIYFIYSYIYAFISGIAYTIPM
jgi:hypothetical protein